jgi:hypothetical protein
MSGECGRTNAAGSAAHPTGRRNDALSLLQLLLSAQQFLERYCGDQPCTPMFLQCISEFRQRHSISERGLADSLSWEEENVPALVRLLVYVQAEAAENLRDQHCADDIEKCIVDLMMIYGLSTGHLYDSIMLMN